MKVTNLKTFLEMIEDRKNRYSEEELRDDLNIYVIMENEVNGLPVRIPISGITLNDDTDSIEIFIREKDGEYIINGESIKRN